MVESRGVPLDLMIEKFDEAGYTIDWIGFYEDAKKTGWNDKTILNRIKYALIDVYDKDYAEIVLEKLKKYIVLIGDP
jgi:hypothetical protein